MAQIASLNRVRKRLRKERQTEAAAASRLMHGRTKAERELQIARDTKNRHDHAQHRLDRGEG